MSETAQNIIESELRPDEELLWAHIVSNEVVPKSPSGAWALVNAIYRVTCALVLLYGAWGLFKTPSEQWLQTSKFYLPFLIGLLLLQLFFTKTNMGKSLMAKTRRPIFQNAIMSDRRILLFNHNSSERRSFKHSDISDSYMDYENGGLALRFSGHGPEKDSLLIGAADFKTALNIIKSNFLKTGLNP